MTRPILSGWTVMPSDSDDVSALIRLASRRGANGILIPLYWRELEPQRGRYVFPDALVDEAEDEGLDVVIQVRDKSFSPKTPANPDWLGPSNMVYGSKNNSGHISKRWEADAWKPLRDLHIEICDHYRDQIIGTATQETAAGVTWKPAAWGPIGYSPDKYRWAWEAMVGSIALACPDHRTYFYGNFLEGSNEHLFDMCRVLNAPPYECAIGGPDIVPNRASLWPFYKMLKGLGGVKFGCAQNDSVITVTTDATLAWAHEHGVQAVIVNHVHWKPAEMERYWTLIEERKSLGARPDQYTPPDRIRTFLEARKSRLADEVWEHQDEVRRKQIEIDRIDRLLGTR